MEIAEESQNGSEFFETEHDREQFFFFFFFD